MIEENSREEDELDSSIQVESEKFKKIMSDSENNNGQKELEQVGAFAQILLDKTK